MSKYPIKEIFILNNILNDSRNIYCQRIDNKPNPIYYPKKRKYKKNK